MDEVLPASRSPKHRVQCFDCLEKFLAKYGPASLAIPQKYLPGLVKVCRFVFLFVFLLLNIFCVFFLLLSFLLLFIMQFVTDRDQAVRISVLNFFVAVYRAIGDRLFTQYLSETDHKICAVIEQKVKLIRQQQQAMDHGPSSSSIPVPSTSPPRPHSAGPSAPSVVGSVNVSVKAITVDAVPLASVDAPLSARSNSTPAFQGFNRLRFFFVLFVFVFCLFVFVFFFA